MQRPRYYYTTDGTDRVYVTRQGWIDLLERCQFATTVVDELTRRMGFVVG